jgi:hypothetical protein
LTELDLHHLKSILGNLRELRRLSSLRLKRSEVSMLGCAVLADNINWLDCFIDRQTKDL